MLAAYLALALAAFAQNAAPKNFNVPAGDATAALKTFSQQAGVEVLFPTDAAQGVRTNAVSGSLTPRAALEQMVAGTGFEVVQDERTGALGLRETAEAKNAASRTATRVVETESGEKAIQMAELRVLGSRIRQTESAGPSPVSTYDREYIRSTGAFTLADFLNFLPQNFGGISSGRGSAPNELNPEFGQRTETSSPLIPFITGAASAPLGQTGQSGVSLRGLGSGSTLVLVDGRRQAQSGAGNRSTDSRQGFVDLNTIPLGMVERVEVITDGASAIYGADAIGGVINVVLKKNWVGTEITASYRGATHGGGHERSAIVSTGFSKGKLRGMAALEYYDRADLDADQRAFSKNQDHRDRVVGSNADGTPIFGRDLRLAWGEPAVVQAQGGAVAGNFDAIPGIRVVLVPVGATSTPAVSQFIPSTTIASGTAVNAAFQRRGNTASYIDLIPASERYAGTIDLTYAWTSRVELYARYKHTDTRGHWETQPALSTASASSGFGNFSTLVPAALNPFNQNVIVGLIHYGFGSIWQDSKTSADSALFGARGVIGKNWEWDAGVSWQTQKYSTLRRDFNGAAISAALSNPDASLRLNPFVDQRAPLAPNQSLIYERMARYGTLNTDSDFQSFDLNADGELFDLWGGPVKMAAGLYFEKTENSSLAVSTSEAVTPVVTTTTAGGSREAYAAYAEFAVPVFGKENTVPLFRRLDITLATRYEDHDAAGSTTVPKVGFAWVPLDSLLIRGSYSEGFRAPALTEYQVAGSSFTSTLTDPRRTPATTTGVQTFRGSNPNIQPETSTNEYLGLVFEPTFIKGLNFTTNYYRTTQKDIIQVISAQTFVNNEALFPGRVTRAAPDATDQSLNQPGRITAVDTTLINFGKVVNHSLDFMGEYRIPAEVFGQWRVAFNAARTLKSTREVQPGVPAIDDEGDTFAPPKWKLTGSVFWHRGPWGASVFYSYLSGFSTNRSGNTFTTTYPISSQRKVDARISYEFNRSIWRSYGKGVRISGGIGNLFDEEPAFADTVFGFNGALHSPMGRTYEIAVTFPIE